MEEYALKIWRDGYPSEMRTACRKRALTFDRGRIAEEWLKLLKNSNVAVAATVRRWNPTILLLYGMIIAYTVYTAYFTIMKHYAFKSTAWDLGIFMQALWTTAHGYGLLYYTPELHVNPSGCFLGQHFSPILLLLVPL